MRSFILSLSALVAIVPAMSTSAQAQTPPSDDPYVWLEDKDGPRAMQWVEAENARTLPRLENDPRYPVFHREALAIATAEDRIPYPNLLNGRVFNLWRDTSTRTASGASPARPITASRSRPGRHSSTSMRSARPRARIGCGRARTCLQPEERLCLIALSEGGEDAVSYREFDTVAGKFVDGGFVLPKAKQRVDWVDKGHVTGRGRLGTGNDDRVRYPFVVKKLTRGQPLAAAQEAIAARPAIRSAPISRH